MVFGHLAKISWSREVKNILIRGDERRDMKNWQRVLLPLDFRFNNHLMKTEIRKTLRIFDATSIMMRAEIT